jgi:DNA-binding transcriptional LysR family regulator
MPCEGRKRTLRRPKVSSQTVWRAPNPARCSSCNREEHPRQRSRQQAAGSFLASIPGSLFLSAEGGNTEQIVEAVEEKKIELGLIEGPARSRDVKTEAFLDDELVLIVSAAHEWAERKSIPCPEIAAVPLLMRERGSGTRRVVEIALARQGVKANSLRIVMELDSTEAIKSAVEAGLGVGFVSRWAIAKDLRLDNSFRIVEVEGLRIQREFLLTYAAGPEPQGLAQEFRRFLFSRAGSQRSEVRSKRP